MWGFVKARLLEGSTWRGVIMLGAGLWILLTRPDLTEAALAMLGSGGLGVVIPEKRG